MRKSQCPRPSGVIECENVVDVGPGIQPVAWYEPATHLCIEPCMQYAQKLRAGGYSVMEMRAVDALHAITVDPDTAIYMLDSLEHMARNEGEEVVLRALELEPRQIVIYTPNGFLPQHGDAWELGGEYWQEHRSGWRPEDFPGWRVEMSTTQDSFYAIWTRLSK